MKHVSTAHAGQTDEGADRTDEACVLSELLTNQARFIRVGPPAGPAHGSALTPHHHDVIIVASHGNAVRIRQALSFGAGVRVSDDDFQRLQIPDQCVQFGPLRIRFWTCGETEWCKLAPQASNDPVEGTMYLLPDHPDLPAGLSNPDDADLGEE